VICLITTPSNSSPKEWPTEESMSGRAIPGLPPVRSGTGEHLVRLDDLSFGLATGHGGLIA
jgi:hypothetical protein